MSENEIDGIDVYSVQGAGTEHQTYTKIDNPEESGIELPKFGKEEAPKKKRAYTRRKQAGLLKGVASSAPAVQAPETPNPSILALQEDILGIVKQRSAAQQAIGHATQAMNQANANLQAAREYLSSLEQEVQYRMNLINQMKGGVPTPAYAHISEVGAWPSGLSVEQSLLHPPVMGPVSSIPQPPRQAPAPNFGGAGIRSESASGFRDQEFQTRAAI